MTQEAKEQKVLMEYYCTGYRLSRDVYFKTLKQGGDTSTAKKAAYQAWHDYCGNQFWPEMFQEMLPFKDK